MAMSNTYTAYVREKLSNLSSVICTKYKKIARVQKKNAASPINDVGIQSLQHGPNLTFRRASPALLISAYGLYILRL